MLYSEGTAEQMKANLPRAGSMMLGAFSVMYCRDRRDLIKSVVTPALVEGGLFVGGLGAILGVTRFFERVRHFAPFRPGLAR